MANPNSHWNNMFIGAITGFFAPMFFSLVVSRILLMYTRFSKGFWEYYDTIFQSPATASSIISLSVLINLLPFFLFYRAKWDKANKGVIGFSLLYCIIVFVLKLGFN